MEDWSKEARSPVCKAWGTEKIFSACLCSQRRTFKPTHPILPAPEQGWEKGRSQGQLSSHPIPSLLELKGWGWGDNFSLSRPTFLPHLPIILPIIALQLD